MTTKLRAEWARWKEVESAYTVGLEEEVMLLDPGDCSLAQRSDILIGFLSARLSQHVSLETHAGVLEIATGVHERPAGAITELSELRRQLTSQLRAVGTTVACAGMHPLVSGHDVRVSGTPRYRGVAETMRFLARRAPTMALHVHVAIPDPSEAIRVLACFREAVPLLVALAANSPFAGGRDTGFASTRTMVFDGFPRTGLPPAFASYAEYVEAINPLIASGMLADPTYLWWDARLQPKLGTVEVRAMDAQTTLGETVGVAALIQSLAMLALQGGPAPHRLSTEVLAENRFLAARDGLDARLFDPVSGRLASVRMLLARLLEECAPYAAALGCLSELEQVDPSAVANGAIRQRSWAAEGRDLRSLVANFSERFAATDAPVVATH